MRYTAEHSLLQLVSSGNEEAFTIIYERYRLRVYLFIKKYLKSSQLSDDICQNVFLKIWENKEELSTINSFNAYAFTIAKRQCLDFLKRAAVEQTAMNLILQAYPLDNNITEENQQYNEYLNFIDNTLLRLPPQTQEVFKLCRQQYKSYDEAAAILGISRHAIKKHMVRSMKVLRTAAETELGISMSILFILLSSF
ncbi:RNA polymerase sigma factor [Pedobacter heparinus]|uniref:RNA polymerase sigma factor, sigma-70 family n=1 Tax=Pedobacter heparinus (strain ATCC 13125 / DSM 2366 / CIP 104194 / JCM 7457 / NBRC 12017 / NCIMB 9290 / NRRL B-14731 / HIM 762-3) TaxID=485917 RepID=C6XYK7_PEDHD|nr:sigma-70 family RNA polymerase sigma factor [Pedobacter heparinus]ACU04489.1 RNA polymerase sigma factor, sigma-70 family [Pedobacter heparinus DSM 2366]